MNLKLGKKGQVLDGLSGLVTALVTVGIVLGVGFLIISQLLTNVTSRSEVVNATVGDYGTLNTTVEAIQDTTNATATIPDFLDIVVITVIGVLLLGLVQRFRS